MAMANNLLGGFGAGFNSGQSAANDIADSRRRNQLSSLASQAYSTPEGERNSLLSQMAAIDPNSAQAQGEAFESEDVRRIKKFENMARLLTSAPEQYREGIYQRMKPSFSGMGAADIPDRYTPEIGQMAEKFLAARSGAGGTPAQLQTFNALTNGLDPADVEKARRIQLGLDGRASSAGFGFEIVKNADGTESMGRTNPRTGLFEVYDQRTGQFQALGGPAGGARQAQAAPQQQGQPGMTQVQYATSDGQPIPASEQAALQAAIAADARGESFNFPVNGPLPQPRANPGLGVSRTPEQEAAAKAQAEANVEFGNYDRMTQLVADRAAAEQRAKDAAANESRELYGSDEQRKQQREAAMKLPQLQEVTRLSGRISDALDDLDGFLINTGPADQYAQSLTPEGQALTSSTGAIQNSMLALTRVPGVGSQSDLEARVANLKYPQLGLHPSVNKARMEDLNAFIKDLNTAYQNVLQGQGSVQQPPAQGGNQFQGFRVLD